MCTWMSLDWAFKLNPRLIAANPSGSITLFVTAWLFVTVIQAEDAVTVRMASGRGQQRVAGEIHDFNGRELVIVRATGREERIPTSRVIDVQSPWGDSHVLAERRMAERQFEDAATLWRKAASEESRPWARRRVMARMVTCSRHLGQDDVAGDLFAALVESDPEIQYFDTIPLSWGLGNSPGGIEAKAGLWMSSARDAMRLVGASWLLTTPRRGDALAMLDKLAAAQDSRIAMLAAAQRWREEGATASTADLTRWNAMIDRLPFELRAGPYYLLANGLARHEQLDQAALAYLRLPIHYPEQRQLAAEGLWSSARLLEKRQRATEARTLYREIVSTYGEAACATQAQARLSDLDPPTVPQPVTP